MEVISNRRAWAIALTILALGVVSVTLLAMTRPLPAGTDQARGSSVGEVAEVLSQATAEVSVPSSWDVETMNVQFGGVGYRASADISDSGTWLLISAAPLENPGTPFDPERSLLGWVDRHVYDKGGRIVAEPIETTASDVEGYLFEVESLEGTKTGQELGALVAIFYGAQYHYQVIAQFEIADRDEMNTLWRNALASLVLNDGTRASASI